MTSFHPHTTTVFFLLYLFQRTREEIDLQMAEENMKLKEMSSQIRNFDIESSKKPESLQKRYKSSIEELANQKQKFMHQLQEVSLNLLRDSQMGNCFLARFRYH